MSDGSRPVLVWDAPTRLFHWLVVLLVAAAYATSRLNWMVWHGRVGYVLLALLLFRLLWGFFGSDTARFSRFLAPPRAVMQHIRNALLREPDRQVGHNPAGGWVVVLLLALLLAETLTGLYVANDIADEGPLTEFVPARVANTFPPRTPFSGTCCWRLSRCMCWRSPPMRPRSDKTCCSR
jgi:cytochrome b